MVYSLNEDKVTLIGNHHFIADNATVIGKVSIQNNSSVWFGAVIRGDEQILIGENTNIQDGAVLHTDPGNIMKIGNGVTIGHRAVVHGCTIGNNTLIGINAVILDNVEIGNNCVIGANSLVKEGTIIPDNAMVVGSPAKIVKELSTTHEKMLKTASDIYVSKIDKYTHGLREQKLS
ncbi:gamma carbonic anhydrase family protein [Aquimarina sp. AD10]|uniref:gamma carbonic anhydrase family protein n=1 Tax=Aquimarina TaxID=290174 RepID=UPI000E4CE7AB|nr:MULTISPECIES: gamma carbonic anhydrase family protein [Aquimarina]AXT60089.1 gamma carbonic anhydrase family protein [Aquimarina sp. AD10]RKM96231.1 gamma carbonic anhydrase family protein [Aquimarina sp. AD10]